MTIKGNKKRRFGDYLRDVLLAALSIFRSGRRAIH